MRRVEAVYVEIVIDAPMDVVWAASQEPGLHQRWDLRFGEIDYRPKSDDEPQQFTYATRVLPGAQVTGAGESIGDRDRPGGARWSGLRFWSDDWRSPVKQGGGYWRYQPSADGTGRTVFLTRFDYSVRGGALGRVVDRVAFRPAFGWATAWSFDRLRLWLEKGIPPETSRDRAVAHALALSALAAVLARTGAVAVRGCPVPGRASDPLSLSLCASALAAVTVVTATDLPSGLRAKRAP